VGRPVRRPPGRCFRPSGQGGIERRWHHRAGLAGRRDPARGGTVGNRLFRLRPLPARPPALGLIRERSNDAGARPLSGRPSSAVHTTAPLSPWQPNVTTCSRLTTGQTRRKQTVAWASIWLNGHSGARPDDPEVLPTVAFVLGYLGENIDVAIGSMDRALGLNPSFARGWAWSGILRNVAGQPDLVIKHFNRALYVPARVIG
jgi:hypothetical protein